MSSAQERAKALAREMKQAIMEAKTAEARAKRLGDEVLLAWPRPRRRPKRSARLSNTPLAVMNANNAGLDRFFRRHTGNCRPVIIAAVTSTSVPSRRSQKSLLRRRRYIHPACMNAPAAARALCWRRIWTCCHRVTYAARISSARREAAIESQNR